MAAHTVKGVLTNADATRDSQVQVSEDTAVYWECCLRNEFQDRLEDERQEVKLLAIELLSAVESEDQRLAYRLVPWIIEHVKTARYRERYRQAKHISLDQILTATETLGSGLIPGPLGGWLEGVSLPSTQEDAVRLRELVNAVNAFDPVLLRQADAALPTPDDPAYVNTQARRHRARTRIRCAVEAA